MLAPSGVNDFVRFRRIIPKDGNAKRVSSLRPRLDGFIYRDSQARRPWRSSDTMNSVSRFLNHFHRLSLQSYQVGGDEGYGHQLMDCMQEEGFYLQRFNSGSPAKRSDIYTNSSAE
jgi:hypothetical protein